MEVYSDKQRLIFRIKSENFIWSVRMDIFFDFLKKIGKAVRKKELGKKYVGRRRKKVVEKW